MCGGTDAVGLDRPVFVDRFCDNSADCDNAVDEDGSVIQCADFGTPTANGCCNTYVMDGEEFVYEGVNQGKDYFTNSNPNSAHKHLVYYPYFGGDKWFRVTWPIDQIVNQISYNGYAISAATCPPSDVTWTSGGAPRCKSGGPILTDHCANSNCHANADCTNTFDSFTCACKPGYDGDGVNQCDALPVEDECATGNNTCDPIGGVCTDTDYSYYCTCDAGFWDENTDNPGRQCDGCCETVDIVFKGSSSVWTSCTLNTNAVSQGGDKWVYECTNGKQLEYLNWNGWEDWVILTWTAEGSISWTDRTTEMGSDANAEGRCFPPSLTFQTNFDAVCTSRVDDNMTTPVPVTISTQAPTTSTEAPVTTSTEAATTSTEAPATTSTQAPVTTSTQAATTSTQAPVTTSTQAATTSTEAPVTTSTQAATTSTEAPVTTSTQAATTSTEAPVTTSTQATTTSTEAPVATSTGAPATSTEAPVTTSTQAATTSTEAQVTTSTQAATTSTEKPVTTSTQAATTSTEAPATTSTDAPVTTSTQAATTSTEAPVTTSTQAATTSTKAPGTTSTEAPVTTSTQAATTLTEAPVTTSTEAPATTSSQAPVTTSTQAATTSTEAPVTTSTQAATTSTEAPVTTSTQAATTSTEAPTTSTEAPTTSTTEVVATTTTAISTSPWTVEVNVKIACAFVWSDDYNDEESDAYKALEQAILDFFNSIFGDLLAQFGFHLEIEMNIIPPGSRRRRDGGDSPFVDVKVKLSGDANDAIDGEVNDDALEEKATEVATEVETTVTDGVSNYSGDVIDNTSTPEVSTPYVIGACDIEARSVISCEPGNIGIAVPACAFPEGANPFMNNANCAGTIVGDQLVFTAGAGDCELTPDADGTHLIYDTSVEWEEGVSNGIISRVNTIKVDFQCMLKTKYSVSLETGISPMLSMVDVDLGSTEGTLELALGLWEDNTFSSPLPSDAVINVPDNLYVAAVLNDAGAFVTSLETCWATPRFVFDGFI